MFNERCQLTDRTTSAVAGRRRPGFTLVELLIVVAIIALLTGILVPSLQGAKDQARAAGCLNNLHNLGVSMQLYVHENAETFWYYSERVKVVNDDDNYVWRYFWGEAVIPVNPRTSPFLKYCGYRLDYLWCGSLPWGSYVPQANMIEPTTCYGYNAWCLDPAAAGRSDAQGRPMPRKRLSLLKRPGELFVFADSAMYWSPDGIDILQNSTWLEPPYWGAYENGTATTHFRHGGAANALCADGHAGRYQPEGGPMLVPEYRLGFVGSSNEPHYDQ